MRYAWTHKLQLSGSTVYSLYCSSGSGSQTVNVSNYLTEKMFNHVHVQVESNHAGMMKVYGDKRQVLHLKAILENQRTACDYKEDEGDNKSMILTITPRLKYEGTAVGRFQDQYRLASVDQMRDGYEMLKMDIIHMLGDVGFKTVSTVFDPQSGAEKHMMVCSHKQY